MFNNMDHIILFINAIENISFYCKAHIMTNEYFMCSIYYKNLK